MSGVNEITGAVMVALVERAAKKAVAAIPAPLDGKDGIGLAGARLVGKNLVLKYTNGAAQDLGRICGTDGEKGRDGRGIQAVELTEDARLVVVYSDGTSSILGQIKARAGRDGVGIERAEISADGRLVFTLSDGRLQDAGLVKAEAARPAPGRDGVGIASAEIDEQGHLILKLTDGRRLDLGRVRGRDGGVVLERGGGGGSSGSGSGSGSSAVGGTVSIDFGAAPGGNYVEQVVAAASVTAVSRVRAWVAGTTSDHNAVEHAVIAGRLGLSVVPGAGQFTIYAATDLRLSGEVALTWEAA